MTTKWRPEGWSDFRTGSFKKTKRAVLSVADFELGADAMLEKLSVVPEDGGTLTSAQYHGDVFTGKSGQKYRLIFVPDDPPAR
jgi:hypothetical protein